MMASRNAGQMVVLAAGGTGGHVFPAEALAQQLLTQGHRLVLVTDDRGTGYTGTLGLIDTHYVAAQGIAGKGLTGMLKGVIALGAGVLQARKLLSRLSPAVVVGFGGYASAPTMFAATQLDLPTVIHEQNAIFGRANQLLARRVNRVCTSFDLAKPVRGVTNIIRTGMPVRPAVAALAASPYIQPDAEGPFRILVIGGSQGATVFSDVIPEAMALLPASLRGRLEISQQCRAEDLDRTHDAYAKAGVHVQLRHFFDNVPDLLAKAHLLIARSGASTIAETCVIGRPSLLVPYPHAADNHQTFNARALATAGGAWMLHQPQFTPAALAALLKQFAAAPTALAEAAAAAASFCVPDAAARLAGVVTDLIGGNNGVRAVTSPGSRANSAKSESKRSLYPFAVASLLPNSGSHFSARCSSAALSAHMMKRGIV